MKSEEATEAGAAVVLLATAGGGPSPKPLAAAAAPLARQPQLLETSMAEGETGAGHASASACRKRAVRWRRCRQPSGGGRGEETFPKTMCSPHHSGNI